MHSATLFFTTVLFLSTAALAADPTPTTRPARDIATKIIQSTQSADDVAALLPGREDVARELIDLFPTLDAKTQNRIMWSVLEIGRPPQPPHRRSHWYFSSAATAWFVQAAASAKDPDARERALDRLREHIPAIYLRIHTVKLLDLARNDALLLGKLGVVEARARLKEGGPLWDQGIPEKPKAALAKLGDTRYSSELIAAFRDAKTAEHKAQAARWLGYVGDPACVFTLAREIRNPATYIAGGTVQSIRVDIVKALSEAYPDNPLFWYPDDPTDQYYIDIETWLQQQLGITLTEDRPPFFHTLPIPTLLPNSPTFKIELVPLPPPRK